MSKNLTKSKPADFGFTTFANLIGKRDPIIGETDLPFAVFHEQLLTALEPMTAHEAVIAENIIAIEWELLQHRRMRDATLRSITVRAISDAVVGRAYNMLGRECYEGVPAQVAAKIAERDLVEEVSGREVAEEREAAAKLGDDLARRVVDPDEDVRSRAEEELIELGLNPQEIMGEAYRSHERGVTHHDDKIQELERRRRHVKADYDALQKVRPLDVTVIEG